jgi:hypothetical protein
MLKHFPVEFPPGMSAGTDRSGADEAGRELTTGNLPQKKGKKPWMTGFLILTLIPKQWNFPNLN